MTFKFIFPDDSWSDLAHKTVPYGLQDARGRVLVLTASCHYPVRRPKRRTRTSYRCRDFYGTLVVGYDVIALNPVGCFIAIIFCYDSELLVTSDVRTNARNGRLRRWMRSKSPIMAANAFCSATFIVDCPLWWATYYLEPECI